MRSGQPTEVGRLYSQEMIVSNSETAIHISEEMSQPGRRVPQIIIMTMMIGLLTSLPLFIALMYFMTDLEAVATSPLPSMELIYQA